MLTAENIQRLEALAQHFEVGGSTLIGAAMSARYAESIRAVLSAGTPSVTGEWRCFHCDEAFADAESAAVHFGTSERQNPICTVDAAEYRAMEQRMARYNEEDSDLHRQIYGLQARHASELRREEEKGYALGLAAQATIDANLTGLVHALANNHPKTLRTLWVDGRAVGAEIVDLMSNVVLPAPTEQGPIDGQAWAKASPKVVFHLIERHDENGAHIGQLMDPWRAAVNAAELVAPPADAQRLRTQAEPTYRFALIRDRNYDGEGLSLWFWNGENYSGTNGDCLSRDPDGSLDGFATEWLTDRQLEQRLNSPDAQRFVAFVGTLISDGKGLPLTDGQRRIKEALSVPGELSLDIVRARIDAALAKQQEPSA